MLTIKNNIGVEAKVYAETFEYEAYDQIKKLIDFEPYQKSKVRIMPDAHAGKGCTVGTTMTIDNKVTPNLVGVDIGCGMLTVKLKDKDIDLEKLDVVINKFIPSGFNVHSKSGVKRNSTLEKSLYSLKCQDKVDLKRALLSVGTLGGGNHFIEVDKGSDGSLYLVIHTGSRKLGGDVCKYYQDKAFQNVNEMKKVTSNLINKLKSEGREKEINEQLKLIQKPSADKDLACLEGNDFDDYLHDMAITQMFAVENRDMIANIILKNTGLIEDFRFETIHNYIDFNRMILRKGAVSAELNETLLIPINMRDGSLLCKGKGNEEWNFSAPHGAGRLMSRSKAKENISLESFEDTMKGIYTSSVMESTIDEAPQAYKDMDEIVRNIRDTVEVMDIIKPIYNFKAH